MKKLFLLFFLYLSAPINYSFAQTNNDIDAIERLDGDNKKITANIIDSLNNFRGNDRVDASNMIGSINNAGNLMFQMNSYIYLYTVMSPESKRKSNTYMKFLAKYVVDLSNAEIENLTKMQAIYDKPIFYSSAERVKSNLLSFNKIISRFQYN